MLIPVTYLIGSLHKKKAGFLAAVFIGCNPIIWFWNNRIMPDILFTVIAATCFYFFYKSLCKRGCIKWQYLGFAIIFGFISYTQQPKLIFAWGIPFTIYFLSAAKRGIKNNRKVIILIIITVILFILLLFTIIFFAPWFFQYDFPKIFSGLFSIFNFSLQDWVEFSSPGGTIWFCFSYPYYFSYTIIILAIVGAFCFAFKHTKRENVLLFLSVGITIYLHITVYSEWGARFSFLIFPILMVLAAIGFTTDIGIYSLLLVPISFLLFPLLLINEPGISTFPQILDLPRIMSILIAIGIIGFKVLEGLRSKLHRLTWRHFQMHANLKISKMISVITIYLVISSSLWIGTSIVTNDQYFRNDYITPDEVGLPQAGNWLATNAPSNAVIITNARAHILSYYTNFSFDIETEDLRINRQGFGTIITPSSEIEFLEHINASEFNYLVVFTEPIVGEPWKRPYFNPYIVEGTLFTIYELVNNTLEFQFSYSLELMMKNSNSLKFSLKL